MSSMSPGFTIVALSFAMLLGVAARAQGTPESPEPARPEEIALNDLFSRCRPEHAKTLEEGAFYRTLGVLRRTDALDKQGRFALVHPVAACCANGIAIGLCVRTDQVRAFENGTRVIVQGHLRAATPPPALPRGRWSRRGWLRSHRESRLRHRSRLREGGRFREPLHRSRHR